MRSPFTNYIVADLETSGLPSSSKRAFYDIAITEIALVAVNQDLEIVEEASWLVKPHKEDLIWEKGAEIGTGISKQMCETQGIDFNTVMREVMAFFKRYKVGSSLPVIVGHNVIKFDIPFIINAFEFIKEDLSKFINDEVEDTLKWGRMCWTESNNYKLGTCCENANITLKDAHRALVDTRANALLWIYFMKNLRGLNAVAQKEEKKFRQTFEM
jgi:DNA polymerase III alpha subunit (gram-positive type)